MTPKILRDTDLVLTMAAHHRGEALQLDASALRRTFTVREFARMLSVLEQRASTQRDGRADPAVDLGSFWRELPARAAAVRHLTLAQDASEDDVVDPYGRGEGMYRQMEYELAPALFTILRFARTATERRNG